VVWVKIWNPKNLKSWKARLPGKMSGFQFSGVVGPRENLAPIRRTRRPFAVAITAAMPEMHLVRGKNALPVPLSR